MLSCRAWRWLRRLLAAIVGDQGGRPGGRDRKRHIRAARVSMVEDEMVVVREADAVLCGGVSVEGERREAGGEGGAACRSNRLGLPCRDTRSIASARGLDGANHEEHRQTLTKHAISISLSHAGAGRTPIFKKAVFAEPLARINDISLIWLLRYIL